LPPRSPGSTPSPPAGATREIVIVDDYSTDGTRTWLEQFRRDRHDVTVLFRDRNQGKGEALRTGFRCHGRDRRRP